MTMPVDCPPSSNDRRERGWDVNAKGQKDCRKGPVSGQSCHTWIHGYAIVPRNKMMTDADTAVTVILVALFFVCCACLFIAALCGLICQCVLIARELP
jgi:hypothetical protein